MNDTAVHPLAAGTLGTVVSCGVAGTTLWLAGHQQQLELDQAGVAGPEEADPHGAVTGHWVGAGGEERRWGGASTTLTLP